MAMWMRAVIHELKTMFKQRIFSIVVDYEDTNDLTMLRPAGNSHVSHLSKAVLKRGLKEPKKARPGVRSKPNQS